VKTITPLDLRRSLGRILDEASAGERFLVERDHKPMAVLVSVEDAARLDEPADEAVKRRHEAYAALLEFRERIASSWPEGVSAAELIRRDRDARDRRDRRRAAGDLTATILDP
jgi:antitoxin (DNA-binding transcriptional repressor) of toxin-antitoxin stability system